MRENKRIVYVVSDVDKSLAFEWTAQQLSQRCDLVFILIGQQQTQLEQYLTNVNIPVYLIPDKVYPGYVRKALRMRSIFKELKPDVVHTQLWRANLIGLSVAGFLRISKRIYTRHHAMIHYREYPQGLKWDKFCNWMATHIVAISENTKEILISLDKADPKKIRIVHHGFDLSYFENIDSDKLETLKSKYQTAGKYPVIGVISRYLFLKGIQDVIASFKLLLNDFPSAHLVLANAVGDFEKEIKVLLQSLPANSVTEIKFESDLATLYRLFDVFVHVPIDSQSEAFGQTYIEALACGIPSVFTLSGVAKEFIVHEQNALVVPYQNSKAIHESICRIIGQPELRTKLISNGKLSASCFSIDKMIKPLMAVYEE